MAKFVRVWGQGNSIICYTLVTGINIGYLWINKIRFVLMTLLVCNTNFTSCYILCECIICISLYIRSLRYIWSSYICSYTKLGLNYLWKDNIIQLYKIVNKYWQYYKNTILFKIGYKYFKKILAIFIWL